jgi:hypothetical protein
VGQFDFVFTLFGLLLGLSLAEVLGGFGKALKARKRVRIGLLTPLLGTVVMFDLVSFWTIAWNMRASIPVNYLTLLGALLLTGAYYLAATLVFPDDPDDTPDFDTHFWANRRAVLGAVFLLNLPSWLYDWWTGTGVHQQVSSQVSTLSFFMLVAGAWVSRRPALVTGLLVVLILLYPLSSIVALI